MYADLEAARRLAAWAPDAARDRLTALLEAGTGDDLALAAASEVLAKVFAVTGAWELAAQAYEQAAAVHEDLGDPALAGELRAVAARFPLAPYADAREALAAELAIIEAALRGAPPTADRYVAELRRALPPRPLLGRLEAAFALAPEEVELLAAAIASAIEPARIPARSAAAWADLLGGDPLGDARLRAIGLCRGAPELHAHPGVVSRLLGRERLEPPAGLRMRSITPGAPPERVAELAAALVGPAIGVVHGTGPRKAVAAAIAHHLGWELLLAHPRLGALPELLADAVIEATLFGSLVAVDLDRWRAQGTDLAADGGAALAARGPLFALAAGDPPLALSHRAFTLALGAVRWPR